MFWRTRVPSEHGCVWDLWLFLGVLSVCVSMSASSDTQRHYSSSKAGAWRQQRPLGFVSCDFVPNLAQWRISLVWYVFCGPPVYFSAARCCEFWLYANRFDDLVEICDSFCLTVTRPLEISLFRESLIVSHLNSC